MKPETWRLLRHLYSQSASPWVCIGDYNEIISSEEKYGRHPKPLPPMVEFRNTLLHYGLIDLGFSGYPYTWQNGPKLQPTINKTKKLREVVRKREKVRLHPYFHS